MTSPTEPTAHPTQAPLTRRRILLINPRFQVSVIFQGLLLVVIVTALFYFYESLLLLRMTETVRAAGTTGGDSAVIVNAIENLHSEMVPWFVMVLVAVSFVIISFLLFFSHRIAGPIYHASNYLNAVGENRKNIRRIGFREKDYFHELADAINRAIPPDSKS